MTVQRFSHLGLCVADLPRALAFYAEGLGFREVSRLEIAGEAAETLLALPGVVLEAVYLERDGLRLELLHYRRPTRPADAVGGAPRPMNAPGLTHLSLRVEHVDAVADALEGLGGRVLRDTRTHNPERRAGAVFVLDPDGTRIELVEATGDPSRTPGERKG